MTTKPVLQALLALSLAGVFQVSAAVAAESCVPVFKQGWLRQPPAGVPMMAGFGSLENTCATPVAVVSASSPAFADVSIHETREVEGVSRMREVERLPLAPGNAAVFKPGGLHLMLMRPKAALKEGDRIALSLKLEDGREVHGELEMRKTAP